ncbi:hypothetical protein JCGZ_13452 [Jatropha curcas]|uniref:Uncharacterized protein n=1 Tax=Jatropha curcas TaxID=180498 RepID=A0A067KAL6_JATCU|nr:hypothetical protein JCGZ_13452 [Jatropha curcas]
MMYCEAVWVFFSRLVMMYCEADQANFNEVLPNSDVMMYCEIDQGNQNHFKSKSFKANQTELRRYLRNQSDRVLEIVTNLKGAYRADQTELWTRPDDQLKPNILQADQTES